MDYLGLYFPVLPICAQLFHICSAVSGETLKLHDFSQKIKFIKIGIFACTVFDYGFVLPTYPAMSGFLKV
jgi:hypothetical protein